MQDIISNYISILKNDRQRRRKAFLLLGVLSFVVACIVVWQLCVPAMTMTQNLVCKKTEHTHSSECYALVCNNTDPEHTHSDECYTLECDKVEHTHDADCYEVSLEDEAKDWTITASFVESKVSEDGNSIDWISSDTAKWDAGPNVTVSDDGKTFVSGYDYTTDRTKEKGSNKAVSVRVQFNYNGDIDRFKEKELRLEIPNLLFGCGTQQYYATEIRINSESLFRFEDGSSYVECAYNYWGRGTKESKISAIETLKLTNYKAVDDAKELQGYFDITYELASGREHDSGFCEIPRLQFADECTHTHISNLDNIRFLRLIPAEHNKSGEEYGFVGNYAAGSDKTGLTLNFERRYIHPWCRPALGISEEHDNSAINYGAQKRISEQKPELTSERIFKDYSWITWSLKAYFGWSYGGVYTPETDYDTKPETSFIYMLLDGHKRYYKMVNDTPYIFSASNLTIGGNYTMKLTTEIIDAFPKDCIVTYENGDLIEPKKDADGNYIEDENGNYVYSFTLSQFREKDNCNYDKTILVGYPKSEYVYNADGSVKTEDKRIVTNTVKFAATGEDGKDYSKTTNRQAILPVDQGGGGGTFVYKFDKSGQWNATINEMLTGGYSNAKNYIGFGVDNVPSADGIDIEITDKDIAIKKNSKSQDLTEISEENHRIREISIPTFRDKNNVAVYAEVTVEFSYPDGTVITEEYQNSKSSYSKRFSGNDMPSSFKITMSDVHDSIQYTRIAVGLGLKYSDELLDQVYALGFDQSRGSLVTLTNSAMLSIRNHKTGEAITKGISDADYYLDSQKEPSFNGWHYWKIDKAKYDSGEKTDFVRAYANSTLSFVWLQKYGYLVNNCTDNFTDLTNGYYHNTYDLAFCAENSPPTNIGDSRALRRDMYESRMWDSLWKNFITAKNSDGSFVTPGIIWRKTAMFDLLPPGVELTSSADQILDSATMTYTEYFFKALRVSDGAEISKEELTELIKSNLKVKITDNYNNTGRTLVTINYDVGEGNEFVVITNHDPAGFSRLAFDLTLKINWRIGLDSILKYGYQSSGITNKITYTISEKGNYVSASMKDPDLLDATLNEYMTSEEHPRLASHTCKITYAGAMTQGILDQVRTSTLGTFLPDNAAEARRTDLNAQYGYQVRLAILSSKITNVKFSNELECNAGDTEYGADKWSGKLSCVDMSDYKGSLGSEAPTAVFTDAENGDATELIWNSESLRFTPPEGKELSGGTLAIDLHNAKLSPDRYYSYYIYLTAPAEHKDGLTSNKASVEYQKLNNDMPDSKVFPMLGNRVFVKLAYPLDMTGLQVEKAWSIPEGKQVTLPERIGFELLRDGEVYKTGTLSAAEEWKTVFTELPVYNQENGDKYVYTIRENAVEGYSSSVELLDEPNTDGFPIWRITNTLIGCDYGFKIIKTDNQGNRLEGAKFELRDSSGAITAEGVTDAAGELVLSEKLEVGETYRLSETEAPSGYRPLSGNEISFTVNDAGEPLTLEHDESDVVTSAWEAEGDTLVITVENQIMYELPESGGIGTTVFYAVGGALMLGAAIVLVARKKSGRDK